MTTATAEIGANSGWAPVRDDPPIVESERTRVYDVPFSNLFETHAKDFNGNTTILRTRAYTESLKVSDNGDIDMVIKGKADGGWRRDVVYPYNFIHNDALFCFKRHKFNMRDEFAINFDLFALDFALVVILNFDDGNGELHIASRDEWTQNGRIDVNGEEVQLFLPVENNRTLPLPAAQVLLSDERVQKWLRDRANG